MVSSFTVHVVSHFREDRVPVLATVLDGILGWKHCLTRTIITSNSDRYHSDGLIDRYAEYFAQRGHTLTLNIASGLANPRMLTWEHKKFLPRWVETASPEEDFFVYIEDDIALSAANIACFLAHRRRLAKHGLIPGFVRYERAADGRQLLVDVHAPEYWQHDRSCRIDGLLYHANANPYWAGYILDQAGAREYMASPSFSPDASRAVCHWNIQERAAMGLTWEHPSSHLRSRVVVPMRDGLPDPDCMVWHASNSYSETGHPVIAARTAAQLYRRESRPAWLARKAAQFWARLRRRP